MTAQTRNADEIRTMVEALPDDAPVESAMQNAYDLGYREDADDDGFAFWTEVLAQASAR